MDVEVKKLRMSKNVIEDIIEVDKTFYFDMDYSSNSWYMQRYNENFEVTVLMVGKVIVGYFIFYGIKEKLYNKICNLEYDNDYSFDNNDIDLSSNIQYLASVLVDKRYREYSFLLILELERQFKSLDKVVALVVSEEGKQMCEKYMDFIGCVNNKACVYVKK